MSILLEFHTNTNEFQVSDGRTREKTWVNLICESSSESGAQVTQNGAFTGISDHQIEIATY